MPGRPAEDAQVAGHAAGRGVQEPVRGRHKEPVEVAAGHGHAVAEEIHGVLGGEAVQRVAPGDAALQGLLLLKFVLKVRLGQ